MATFIRTRVLSTFNIRSRSRKRLAAKVRSDPYDEHREAEEGGLRQKIVTKSEDDDDAWHQVFIFTCGGACVALH